MRSKHLRWVVLGTACLGLGISVPQCPAEKAMQQQIESLEKKDASNNQRIQMMDSQVKAMAKEVADTKAKMEGMAGMLATQQQAVDSINQSLKAMMESKSKPGGRAKKR